MVEGYAMMPKVGDEMTLISAINGEEVNARCVHLIQDDEDPNIKYACFYNLDNPTANIHEEMGIPFWEMRGYVPDEIVENVLEAQKNDNGQEILY